MKRRRPKDLNAACFRAEDEIVHALRTLIEARVISGKPRTARPESWRTNYLQSARFLLTQAIETIDHAIAYSQEADEKGEIP